MRERRRFRRISVYLDGTIEFQRTKEKAGCVIRDISEECMGAMIVTSDPRVCAKEDVNLSILIPGESSPAKCTGRITWYSSADEGPFKGLVGYLAGIFITHMSRLDQRRLELLIERKKAFFGVR